MAASITQALYKCLVFKKINVLSDVGMHKRPRQRNPIFPVRSVGKAVLSNTPGLLLLTLPLDESLLYQVNYEATDEIYQYLLNSTIK